MENTMFNKIQYDYYSNTSSYVKMILDMLPESMASIQKKLVIKELYNYFLNHFDEEKIREISTISKLFREKISVSSLEDTANFVNFVCKNYLDKIVFDSANREIIFNIFNDSMKVYVGYFTEYNNKKEVNYIR